MENETHHHHHHHSHHSAAADKKDPRFYVRIAILCIFVCSVLVYVPYVAHKFLPFLRSVSYYHKINVSSICYIALRICLMALPIILALPGLLYKEYMEKPKLIGKCLGLISFFYFTGMVADIVTYNVIGGYVDDGSDPIMLKLLWNNTDTVGIFFCGVQGALYLILSKMLRGHKKNIVIMFFITFAAGALMPFAYAWYTHTIFSQAWYVWFYKNIYFYISQAITFIGLLLSATSRWLWSSAFWH